MTPKKKPENKVKINIVKKAEKKEAHEPINKDIETEIGRAHV